MDEFHMVSVLGENEDSGDPVDELGLHALYEDGK